VITTRMQLLRDLGQRRQSGLKSGVVDPGSNKFCFIQANFRMTSFSHWHKISFLFTPKFRPTIF